MSEMHVVFGTGQVGHALIAQLAGVGIRRTGRVAAPPRPRCLKGSTGAVPTPPILKQPPTPRKAHRSSTNVSTPPTPSGPNCSPRCRGVCWPPQRTPMRCS